MESVGRDVLVMVDFPGWRIKPSSRLDEVLGEVSGEIADDPSILQGMGDSSDCENELEMVSPWFCSTVSNSRFTSAGSRSKVSICIVADLLDVVRKRRPWIAEVYHRRQTPIVRSIGITLVRKPRPT